MIQGLEWCPKSLLLVVWDCSQNIYFFELTGIKVQSLHCGEMPSKVNLMTAFTPDCNLFLVAGSQSEESKIHVYNLLTFKLSAVLDNRHSNKQKPKKINHQSKEEGK